MQITLTVSDKVLKSYLNDHLDDQIFLSYDADVIKAAKVPAKKVLLNQLLNDKNYIAKLQKNMINQIPSAEELLSDAILDVELLPALQSTLQKCDDKLYNDSRKEKEIAQAIATLKESGYKITK